MITFPSTHNFFFSVELIIASFLVSSYSFAYQKSAPNYLPFDLNILSRCLFTLMRFFLKVCCGVLWPPLTWIGCPLCQVSIINVKFSSPVPSVGYVSYLFFFGLLPCFDGSVSSSFLERYVGSKIFELLYVWKYLYLPHTDSCEYRYLGYKQLFYRILKEIFQIFHCLLVSCR